MLRTVSVEINQITALTTLFRRKGGFRWLLFHLPPSKILVATVVDLLKTDFSIWEFNADAETQMFFDATYFFLLHVLW